MDQWEEYEAKENIVQEEHFFNFSFEEFFVLRGIWNDRRQFSATIKGIDLRKMIHLQFRCVTRAVSNKSSPTLKTKLLLLLHSRKIRYSTDNSLLEIDSKNILVSTINYQQKILCTNNPCSTIAQNERCRRHETNELVSCFFK